ncbi:methionyl-tRNA formyltransferase [Lachnospiraceae bacterium KM106-2]|nr:methionyl-tRNA formyltransferase [Lachnospiraceae bacterium KM106-2]
MRVVFMGTPDFSVPTLEKLIEAKHEVVAVVTQPDKPKGRGKSVQCSPVKEAALAHGIEVFQPVKVREPECVEKLRTYNADVFVVVAFGQILPKEILDMPKYGCVNVHGSLLPKYRGAAPIQWAVIDGEKTSGVTTMMMDVGIDTGDMLLKSEITLDEKETGGSLFDKLKDIGADLLVETLAKIEAGTITPEKQDDSQSNYAKMLTKSFGIIDFKKPAVQIERLIRGLNPWPSAYTTYGGKTLKIWSADVLNENFDGEIGQIVKLTKNEMIVKTGEGALSLQEVQLEGKKRMDIESFLRGRHVEENGILG